MRHLRRYLVFFLCAISLPGLAFFGLLALGATAIDEEAFDDFGIFLEHWL